ncbi:MAG: DUF4238 domain-containing protein [Acidobacteria bacterium]|nr:DUF4238 domain-containing protein [Acidobacteriota bacterium]MBI3663894.1 DUF4238 domain-containing protein [Acidobacteriota bacterium]
MAANGQGTVNRNRLDHVLPQGYLEGFTSPSQEGQVWVFDRQEQLWFDTGTRGIGAIRGFYDYPLGSQPDQTADQAFAELEARFPHVRRKLVANNFSNWREHLDSLLHFAQMLRARSKLFRDEHLAYTRGVTMLDATLLRNKAITDMRTEIGRGPGWLSEFYWCLRLTASPTDPVITADNPVVVDGIAPTFQQALQDAHTRVSFPICWQACLVGRKAKFDKQSDAFLPGELDRLRSIYLQEASRFVFSPSRIASLSADQRD